MPIGVLSSYRKDNPKQKRCQLSVSDFLYSFLTPLFLSCLQDYRESTAASPALLLQARKVSCF